MFENIKTGLKYIRACYRVGRSGGFEKYLNNKILNNNYIEKIEIENIHVFIIKDDDAVLCTGFRYAAVTRIKYLEEDIICIIYENETEKLNILDYILNHEIGHIIYDIIPHPDIYERTLESEIIADAYAASKIGKERTTESLNILAEQDGLDVIEIYIRIFALNKLL